MFWCKWFSTLNTKEHLFALPETQDKSFPPGVVLHISDIGSVWITKKIYYIYSIYIYIYIFISHIILFCCIMILTIWLFKNGAYFCKKYYANLHDESLIMNVKAKSHAGNDFYQKCQTRYQCLINQSQSLN